MILITGATGLTGSAVVREFVRQGRPARILVRDPAKIRASAPGIETVQADLLVPDTLPAALDGIDTVVLISGADDRMVEAQGNLIDTAVTHGVDHIVKVSGMGADPRSPFRFGRFHAQIEHHLQTAGVGWTLLRPSQFMQVYYREIPTMLADGTLAQPLGDARLAPIDVEDIAKVAYLIATGGSHRSASYEMTGPEALTMTEVCAILTSVVGSPVRYVDIAPEDKHRRLRAAGLPPRFADDLDDLFRLRRNGGPESHVAVEVFEQLGLRPTSFAEFAQRSATILRGTSAPETLWASGWQNTDAAS
ncbi:SDR family oxidoreductase [Amycolatopsis pithecellobii]|uniref:NAD(P)H-binding protein n=1 Tax=Amycolatopsis pithecellobii TaxID=664692 RepID=A0A6N7Z4F2_9PSEU|nr:SDR family oxidoreductase [Amycolatopsis pithecellobii]MTD55160.1 NAD(P)H-binding protein [Amycolatopsis pithecellobii]